jgi:hypothetical protein
MTIGATVSTSRVKLRVGISVVDARAEVSYVLPVAAISYIDMKLTASLDVLNKNPYVGETQVVVDKAVLAVAKKFFETLSVPDGITSKAVSLSKTDSVVATEDILSILITFIRNFADSTSVSDTVAVDALKNLFESVANTDTDSYDFSKFIPDGVAMQDGADIQDGNKHHFEKYVMNMAFPTDANQKFFEKLLLDSFNPIDAASVSFSKALFDSFAFTDTQTFDFGIVKSDSVNTTESLTSAFSKQISPDSIAFSDQIVKNPGKGLSDSAVPEDVGSLRSQGYCDITYFAEDYVGESRTFT